MTIAGADQSPAYITINDETFSLEFKSRISYSQYWPENNDIRHDRIILNCQIKGYNEETGQIQEYFEVKFSFEVFHYDFWYYDGWRPNDQRCLHTANDFENPTWPSNQNIKINFRPGNNVVYLQCCVSDEDDLYEFVTVLELVQEYDDLSTHE